MTSNLTMPEKFINKSWIYFSNIEKQWNTGCFFFMNLFLINLKKLCSLRFFLIVLFLIYYDIYNQIEARASSFSQKKCIYLLYKEKKILSKLFGNESVSMIFSRADDGLQYISFLSYTVFKNSFLTTRTRVVVVFCRVVLLKTVYLRNDMYCI